MAQVIYEPQHVKDPKNHPRRIYFSCEYEDRKYYDKVSRDIFGHIEDCVIAHADHSGSFIEYGNYDDIENSHLFVIMVSACLLDGQGGAWEEFLFAAEKNIAILPLLCEDSIDERFNDMSGDRQFLRLSDPEYEEKLARTLDECLVDDGLSERVEQVFVSRMFLSYCREDRGQLERALGMLRSREENRAISVWYDKYLTMGKNFASSLSEKLDECEMFGITLTPNIVTRDNYVVSTEYPHAHKMDKHIMLFEMEPTDRDKLPSCFPGSEKYTVIGSTDEQTFHDELAQELTEELETKRSLPQREREYLLGMAYLNGIGVEFDREYARGAIESSAKRGSIEAIRRLVIMYGRGIGVDRSPAEAIKWQKKAVEHLRRTYGERRDELLRFVRADKNGRWHPPADGRERAGELMTALVDAACDLSAECLCLARMLRDENMITQAEKRYRDMFIIGDEMDKLFPGIRFSEHNTSVFKSEWIELCMMHGIKTGSTEKEWEKTKKQYDASPDEYHLIYTYVNTARMYALELVVGRGYADERAYELLCECDGILTRAKELFPDDTVLLEMHLKVSRDLALSFSARGKHKDAIEKLESIYDILASLEAAGSKNEYNRIKIPETTMLKGDVYRAQGNIPDAIESYISAFEGICEVHKQTKELDLPGDYIIAVLEIMTLCIMRIADMDEQSPPDDKETEAKLQGTKMFLPATASIVLNAIEELPDSAKNLRKVIEYAQNLREIIGEVQ